jgi:hypothetical protein
MRQGQCCQRNSATLPKPPDISISSCVGLCVAELLPCFIDPSEEDLGPFHTATDIPTLRRLDPAVGKIRRCGVAVSKNPRSLGPPIASKPLHRAMVPGTDAVQQTDNKLRFSHHSAAGLVCGLQTAQCLPLAVQGNS